jgi:hypothetical protein
MGIKGRRRQRWKMLCRFLANEKKRGRWDYYFARTASGIFIRAAGEIKLDAEKSCRWRDPKTGETLVFNERSELDTFLAEF